MFEDRHSSKSQKLGQIMLFSTWILLAIPLLISTWVFFTTNETGVERELAATVFGLFGWPMYMVALLEFFHGIKSFRNVSLTWKIINLVNPILVAVIPFFIVFIFGIGS